MLQSLRQLLRRLRSNEAAHFLALRVNEQDGRVALNPIGPHNGRTVPFIGVNPLKGKLVAKLCL
ncbi:MAG: hypothetical protein KJ077_40665 [Anaerolineae bacterium]|nr:hypothetical protein [Anaerolineae bacterium]